MSASAMTNFVRELFTQTDDYQSLTHRIIRERYMKHTNVAILAEDERSLLREIVDLMVKDTVENSVDDVQQQVIVKSEQSVKIEIGIEENENKNEKSTGQKSSKPGKGSEEDGGKVTNRKRQRPKIVDDSDSENSSDDCKRSAKKHKVVSSSESDDSNFEPKGGKKKKATTKIANKKTKLSDSNKNTDKSDKKGAIPKRRLADLSDSEGSDAEKPKPSLPKKTESAAKANIPNSKKTISKRKLSSSEDELSVKEEINAVNIKREVDSDSNDSEPLQSHRERCKETAVSKENFTADSESHKLKSNASDGSESDELTLASVKKFSSANDSDEDSDQPVSSLKSKKKSNKSRSSEEKKKKLKGKSPPASKVTRNSDEKDETVKKLEKIARTCGVLPVGKRYKLTFESCRGNKERAEKLKQMLRDAGMTGTISMKSAETLKLKREAAELLSDVHCIMTEGRGLRSSNNPFSKTTRKRESSESSTSSAPPPAKESFSRLKGIVDSEEESD